MTRKSLIVGHPNKLQMERKYLQGSSIASIAREFGVGEESLRNHVQNNMSRQLVKAYEQKELTSSLDTLSEIDQIITYAKDIFKRNYDKGADITALKALDSQRSTLELLCKISAFLHQTKLLELQEAQTGDNEEKNEEFQKSLSVLTTPELKMLLRIQNKLETQDRKDIIIPESPSLFNELQEKQPISSIISESNTFIPLKEDRRVFRREKVVKQPISSNIDTPQETVDQYNARILAEEYGNHFYENGRVQSNKVGSPFEGECRNVIIRDI